MRKMILGLLTATFAFGSIQADECCETCTGNYYVGALGGISVLHSYYESCEDGGFGGLYAGYKFASNLRLEGELMVMGAEKSYYYTYFKKSQLWEVALLANVIYDIDLGCNWTPYFGVGCGYDFVHHKVKEKYQAYSFTLGGGESNYSRNSHKFIWQGIAGIAYDICEYRVGLDYRRVDVSNCWTKDTFALSLTRFF